MAAALEESLERPLRLFTRADYHAMAESGILREQDHVELIEGKVTAMMPVGPWHAASTNRIVARLCSHYGDTAVVAPGNPVGLGDFSEPQPDVTVLRQRNDFYAAQHPGPDDVLLLIEVSDTTRSFDLVKKRNLYAAHGIREYWVVDGERQCVHVFRRPAEGAYSESRVYLPGEILTLPESSGKTLPVNETGVGPAV